MSLVELLSIGPGAVVYHLLVVLTLWAMGIIALVEWRHTRNPDHRRVLWAFGALLALRFPLLFGELVGPALFAPFLNALEPASLVILGGAFLAPALGSRTGRLYLLVGLGLTAACAFVFLPAWSVALEQFPYVLYLAFWQQPFWYAWSALLALMPVVALTRGQRKGWRAPAVGFAILLCGSSLAFIGALLLTAGWGEMAGYAWIGVGRLISLLGYSFFAVAVYHGALQDMWAYRQELQIISEEALRQTQELLFLVEASRTTGESLDLDTILERVAESAAMVMDSDCAAIFLLDPERPDMIRLAAQYTPLPRGRSLPESPILPLAALPMLDEALRQDSPMLLNVESDHSALCALYELLGAQRSGPTIIQPLARQNRVLGALVVGNDYSQRAFEPAKSKLCQSMAAQVAAAVENARLYRDLQMQASRLAELLQEREEEARQQAAILESIAEGVIVGDKEGRVTIVNAAAETILGAPRQRIVGRLFERLTGHAAQDPQVGWKTLAQASAPLQTVFELEGKVVHVSAAPVLTPSGDRLGMVAVLRDISKEMEGERAKSELITAVSHELRTPLTAIRGYAEALSGGMAGAVNESQARFLGIIRDHVARMASLIENLIAVADFEKGRVRLEYGETDLHLIVGDVLRALHREIRRRELDVRLELEDGLPMIEADPARVRQIVDNLVSNAVKFTYPGGRITIGARMLVEGEGQSPTHCRIWVSDTGIGIPPEEQARVWERFYRPPNPLAAEASGLGVGLSIVKLLVEAHGGRVWLESAPGAGSTFTVLLPIKRPAPPFSVDGKSGFWPNRQGRN